MTPRARLACYLTAIAALFLAAETWLAGAWIGWPVFWLMVLFCALLGALSETPTDPATQPGNLRRDGGWPELETWERDLATLPIDPKDAA